MNAPPLGLSVREILRELCERLEDLCYQQASDDLQMAVTIIEELALQSPRLDATRPLLQQALEADGQFLDQAEPGRAVQLTNCASASGFSRAIEEDMMGTTPLRFSQLLLVALVSPYAGERLNALDHVAVMLHEAGHDPYWLVERLPSLDDPFADLARQKFERWEKDWFT